MKRTINGLANSSSTEDQLPDGLYLVRIERMAYRWERQKPFYSVRLAVIQPAGFADSIILGRLYCTPKALWKLAWFLRDFGYDQVLFGRDEIDDRAVVGLRGVVRLTHTTANGRSYQNLDAFAPEADWQRLQSFDESLPEEDEVA
jgi:hypothetical protein